MFPSCPLSLSGRNCIFLLYGVFYIPSSSSVSSLPLMMMALPYAASSSFSLALMWPQSLSASLSRPLSLPLSLSLTHHLSLNPLSLSLTVPFTNTTSLEHLEGRSSANPFCFISELLTSQLRTTEWNSEINPAKSSSPSGPSARHTIIIRRRSNPVVISARAMLCGLGFYISPICIILFSRVSRLLPGVVMRWAVGSFLITYEKPRKQTRWWNLD